MAQIALNFRKAVGDANSVTDCPDTLQDLCIFYLMNNLDVLVPSLNKTQGSNEEFSSSFSLLHANKMLGYYSKCCLPCDFERPYIDQLMEKCHQCDEISITSTRPLALKNVKTLACFCKSVRRLHLTCFDYSARTNAFRTLLENNLQHLTTLKLSQKCEEDFTIGILNLLGGRDCDADVEMPDSSDGDDDDHAQATSLNMKKAESDSEEKTDLQIRNLGTETVTDMETVETEDEESANISSKIVSNLKSFNYLQIYTSVHPNLQPCRSFGWFYALLSSVISNNQHLQSFTFVTLLSNPVEWFLSQPDLPKLKDLQSLCLSFEYLEGYSADSDEIKMPYTDKFFTNLPILQNLRHLDISCSIPIEDYDTSKFVYSEQVVEMFIEAVKELPQLTYLDISGTNLAKIICHKDKGDAECRDHCMPGFEDRQFDFLGLYGTDECTHKFIPADRVSGNASIEQLLEALMSLQNNLIVMSVVIEDINEWIKEHTVDRTVGLALIDGFITFLTGLGEWDASYSELAYSEPV